MPTRVRATVTPAFSSSFATSPYIRYSSMSGVPPSPLSMTIVGPDVKSRSARIGSTSCSAIADAGASGTRCRPGSPWMPTPISIWSSGRSKVGLPADGTVQLVSAMPIERPDSLTLRASAATDARSRPSSAAAPTIFSSSTVTPTPRRPAVQVESSTATSSFVTTDSTCTPDSAAASSAPISKFITSPV